MLGSVTLLASAAGGLIFGVVADRYGRTRALMASVLIYSVFTAACGFAQTVAQLAVFRVLLGIGMGGEWASGAALVSRNLAGRASRQGARVHAERLGDRLRRRRLVTALVLPRWGWRARVLRRHPAGVPHALGAPQRDASRRIWRATRARRPPADRGRFARHLPRRAAPAHGRRHDHERVHACSPGGASTCGCPATCRCRSRRAASGCRRATMSVVRLRDAGRDVVRLRDVRVRQRRGRPQAHLRRLPGDGRGPDLRLHVASARRWRCSLLGPFVAFFATGYFSGFGAVTAEIYPTDIRATAQGFTYNIGRIASAAAPFAVGSLAQTRGFQVALSDVGRVPARRADLDLDPGDQGTATGVVGSRAGFCEPECLVH